MISKHNSLEHLNNSFIYLAQIGWEVCEPNHSCTGFRDMHLIHIIKRGYGTFEIKGKKHSLGPNELFYIPPNTMAYYCSDSETPWEYYYFAFNGAYSTDLLQSSVLCNNYIAKIDDANPIFNIIKAASEDIMTKEFPDLYGCEQLFKILPYIMIHKESTSSTYKYLTEAENYMQAHYNEDININKITNYLNIDRSYFYRIFKNHFGVSPVDYLINIRFQQARKLLSETDLSTSEIARIVGYDNYSPFYIMFQKKMGIPPKEFRLLQIGHTSATEKMSITTVRIFKNMQECEKILKYNTSIIPPKDAFIAPDFSFLNSYNLQLIYNSKKYDFYAYEFENESYALKYFQKASKSTPQDNTKGFKIKSTSHSAELTVFNRKFAYRLLSDDIKSLNLFRHILNEHFTHVIIH